MADTAVLDQPVDTGQAAPDQVAAATPTSTPEAPPEQPVKPAKPPIRIQLGEGMPTLEFPGDASQESITSGIQHFVTTPEFAAGLDRETGAPAGVRATVGGAPEQDRLTNLRRFYPHAMPYGEDNFVFLNPNTGKMTLYNKPGLDLGDVASVGREISQAVGATMGATYGATGGFVAGTPGGPPTMLAGAGAGAAVGAGTGMMLGGAAFDTVFELFGGMVDTRNIINRTSDYAFDWFAGATAQRAGEVVEAGAKRALGGLKPMSQRIAESFRSMKVEIPAAAVTGSKAIGSTEKMLELHPVSSPTMQARAERVISQTKAAAQRVAASFGRPLTPEGAGEAVQKAAVGTATRFGARQDTLYIKAFDLVGADTVVPVASVSGLRGAMQRELSAAPNSLKPALGKAIEMLQAVEDDAAQASGIKFSALRQIRTMVGKQIDQPLLAGSSGPENAALKRIYGALTEDMSAAAKQAGPDAAKALQVADRYTRAYMTTAAETMQKLADFDAPDRAWRYVIAGSKDGGSLLARLRRNFTPEEWDTVAGTVLDRLGLATPGAQDMTGQAFSVNTFMTNWSKLAPEAKEALFGGSRYAELRPALDQLVDVVSSLKNIEKLANTSNTGRINVAYATYMTLLSGLGYTIQGDLRGAVGAAVTGAAAPYGAAKLITSPAFVEWLTTPITNANGLGPHLARLSTIVEGEPGLRDLIGIFVANLGELPEAEPPGGPVRP